VNIVVVMVVVVMVAGIVVMIIVSIAVMVSVVMGVRIGLVGHRHAVFLARGIVGPAGGTPDTPKSLNFT
jgi:hypothetical protein